MESENLATIIFGEASSVCHSSPVIAPPVSAVERLTSDPLYLAILIIFAVLYMLWLPHIIRGKNIRWSRLKRNIYNKKDSKREVIAAPQFNVAIITWTLCIALIVLLSLRFVAQYSPLVPERSWQELLIMAGAATLTILAYEWGVLKICGYLTTQGEFIKELLSFRGQVLFMCVVILSPLLIMCGFANAEQGEIAIQLSLCVIVIFAAIFVYQTFLLFMRQNFSILHWILYLCAVEIFPLTFIWAIISRGASGV